MKTEVVVVVWGRRQLEVWQHRSRFCGLKWGLCKVQSGATVHHLIVTKTIRSEAVLFSQNHAANLSPSGDVWNDII